MLTLLCKTFRVFFFLQNTFANERKKGSKFSNLFLFKKTLTTHGFYNCEDLGNVGWLPLLG